MLTDITLSTGVTLSAETCNFDLGGKTVTYAGANGRVATFDIAANANVTMTNGNINYSSSYTNVSENIIVNSGATLNLGNTTADSSKPLNITCTGGNYPVCVFINGGTVNINNDATLTENPYFAIMYYWANTVTSHCNINGGTVISHATGAYGTIYFAGKESSLEIKSGSVTYDGSGACVITTDGLSNGSFTMTGGTLENTFNDTTGRTIPLGLELKNNKIENVNITGGTISSTYGNALAAYQSATIGGTVNITGGKAGIATHYGSDQSATITIEGEASISGGEAGILLREDSTINVNSGTVDGGISVTDGTGNSAKGTINVNGGTIEGDVRNTATGASTVKIAGGEVKGNVITSNASATTEISNGSISGNVSTTSGTTKVMGGEISGNVENTGTGSTEVSGGTITGNVAEELIASGYEKDSNGVIRADAAWSLRSGSDVVYDYILKTSTPATIATATIATAGDSSVLRHNTQYGLLGVSNEVEIELDSELARQKNFYGAKYNIADGTVAITPLNAGFKIIGDTFVDDATTLTTNDRDSYGIAVDATDNKLANITGGDGDDSIKAGARATTLDGGAGNDTLEGNSEADTFIYSAGNDEIKNYTYGTDTFNVASDSDLTLPTSFDDVNFTGSDLFVTIDNNNTLVFRSAANVALVKDTATYSYQGHGSGTMNYIAFNSETEHGISLGAGYSGRFNGANAANEDYATIDASHVTSAIRVTGNDNNNYMVAGTGGGTFEGGAGNDIINGASATSSLRFVGGDGDDSLVGGNGYNVFVYTEGNDKIKYYHDGDLVNVNNSVNLANAEFSLSDDNFILGFGSGDSLTLENVATIENGVSIQSGSSSKNIYVYKKDSIARNKSITLTSGFTAESFGPDIYDTINAVAVGKAISVIGNDNNNVIFGSKQGGTLFGGAGKDKLDVTERNSGKTFVFKYTEGKDTVSGFVAGDKLEITADKIDEITKAKSSRSDTRLAFTFSKSDVLTFNSEDEVNSVSLNSGGFLTKDGVVKDTNFKLFASARGKIDLTEAPYASASLNAVDASEVKKQSVTLIGASVESGSSYTFAGNNKKKDLFEYNGGNVSISGYEAGVDRLDLNTAALGTFSVSGGKVSLTTGLGTVVLESMQGNEVLLHHAESKRSSFTKMVFKDTGVIFNKEKRPTAATVSGSYNISSDSTASTVKKISWRTAQIISA